jgi:hypothetical protein
MSVAQVILQVACENLDQGESEVLPAAAVHT